MCGASPPESSLELELAHDGEAERELRDVEKDQHDRILLLPSVPS